MNNRNVKFTYFIEVSIPRSTKTVEYEVRCEVWPGDPGKSTGPPEKCYPPEQPSVENLEVWYVEPNVKCTNKPPPGVKICPICKNKGTYTKQERREELEELIDDADVIEKMYDHRPEDEE